MPDEDGRTQAAKDRKALEAERKAVEVEKAELEAKIQAFENEKAGTVEALSKRDEALAIKEADFKDKVKELDDILVPDVESRNAMVRSNKAAKRKEYVCTVKCFHRSVLYKVGRRAWFAKGEYPMDKKGKLLHFILLDPAGPPPPQPRDEVVLVNKPQLPGA